MPTSFKVEIKDWGDDDDEEDDDELEVSHWNFILLVPNIHVKWIVKDFGLQEVPGRTVNKTDYNKDICAVQDYGNSRLPSKENLRWGGQILESKFKQYQCYKVLHG